MILPPCKSGSHTPASPRQHLNRLTRLILAWHPGPALVTAEHIGLPRSTWSQTLSGQQAIYPGRLKRLAQIFSVDEQDLVTEGQGKEVIAALARWHERGGFITMRGNLSTLLSIIK